MAMTPEPPPHTEPNASTVMMSFEGPPTQRRLTVAFRLILAIPHIIWLYIYAIAVVFVVFIGWFVALFIGRLPDGFATFLSRFLRYSTRVYAYLLLLTDKYPPFNADADYPVSVDITTTRLNRFAVLFRLILMIPAGIVTVFVNAGLVVCLLVIWLIVLITARMPQSVFEAEAATQRYIVRYYAFASMLTGEYPKGLFGDGDAPATMAPPATDAPSAIDAPEDAPFPPPPTFLPSTPRVTRLVLSRGGRRMIVLFIVLGVLVQGGSTTATIVRVSKSNTTRRQLQDAKARVDAAVATFGREAQQCALSGGPVCLHQADNRLADAFDVFDRDLQDISFPQQSLAGAQEVESDSRTLRDELHQLATINDLAGYQAQAQRFQTDANKFDSDYRELLLSLFGR